MEIVINKCYGGFGLSDEAYQWLIDEKGWKASEYNKDGNLPKDARISISDDKPNSIMDKYYHSWYDNKERSDPDLIAVVKALGEKANGRHAQLVILDIPDNIDFEINDYDGIESIHEAHRSW